MDIAYKGYTIKHYKDHYKVVKDDGSEEWEVQTVEEGKYDIDEEVKN